MGKLTGESSLSAVSPCRLSCRKFFGLLLTGLIVISCTGYPVRSDRPRGVYHRVKSGENLLIIARAYHVDLQELAEINNISNADRIETDAVIFIPDANQVLDDLIAAKPQPPLPPSATVRDGAAEPKVIPKTEPPRQEKAMEARKTPERPPADTMTKGRAVPPEGAERETPPPRTTVKPEAEKPAYQPAAPRETAAKSDQIQFDKKRFVWPVKGKVVSHFGIQPNRMYFNGIRIEAGEGTAVQAAADGWVIFSAPLKDYGETIIIQHEDQYATVYSHLAVRTVRGESKVKKGDRIAFLGKSDDREEPYLHFEIRYRNKARNPLFFLP